MKQSPIAFLYNQPWINSVESSELRALHRQTRKNKFQKIRSSEVNQMLHIFFFPCLRRALTHSLSPCPICCCRFRIHKTKRKIFIALSEQKVIKRKTWTTTKGLRGMDSNCCWCKLGVLRQSRLAMVSSISCWSLHDGILSSSFVHHIRN